MKNEPRAKPEDAGPFIAGDIVHYMLGGSHLIAIITAEEYPPDLASEPPGFAVDPRIAGPTIPLQALIVFPPMGAPFAAAAPRDEEFLADLTWHTIRRAAPAEPSE